MILSGVQSGTQEKGEGAPVYWANTWGKHSSVVGADACVCPEMMTTM